MNANAFENAASPRGAGGEAPSPVELPGIEELKEKCRGKTMYFVAKYIDEYMEAVDELFVPTGTKFFDTRIEVVGETEKAWKVKEIRDGIGSHVIFIPKSQARKVESGFFVKSWLARREFYDIVRAYLGQVVFSQ
jgi:hypothetical protein